MFPHKKAMTPNQVMGHHQLLQQQGVAAINIASSIGSKNTAMLAGQQWSPNQPFSAFDAGTQRAEHRSSWRDDTWRDQQHSQHPPVHPVVEKALAELANQKMDEYARAKSKEDDGRERAREEEEASVTVKKCFLHKKPNKGCKKCQQAMAQSSKDTGKDKQQESSGVDQTGGQAKRPMDDKKELKCSPMLKEQIVNSSYFKRLLNIKDVKGLIHEIVTDVDTIDVYNAGSKISPSVFICHVFRLSTFPHLGNELDFILDHRNNAVVRCVGFVYVRYVTPATELWDMLEEYLLDDMELVYNQDGATITATIGEYVESLLTEEKYFDSPLPRLPVKIKSLVEEKVAPMLQHRKRMQANRRALTPDNIEDTTVEVCMDGSWMRGIAQGFANKVPSRTKVNVKLEGGVEVKVHLGKMVIAGNLEGGDREDRGNRRANSRSRSRSRGRRGTSPDWSRFKGKSDAACLQEFRDRNKDQAVCSSGKHYAKKPLTFDASMASTAMANPAGADGVDFSSRSSRRGGGNDREDEAAAEEARLRLKQRDEAERQRGLAAVYKKYCATPSASSGSAYKEVDTPDMLRLG